MTTEKIVARILIVGPGKSLGKTIDDIAKMAQDTGHSMFHHNGKVYSTLLYIGTKKMDVSELFPLTDVYNYYEGM